MRQAAALLLASVLLAGCSTVGNVLKKTGQILMDPSIPVGAPEDQPTRIALSLYASADVNPNAQTDTAPAGPSANAPGKPMITAQALAEAEKKGPFVIQLQSETRAGLVQTLSTLLDHLDTMPPAAKGHVAATGQTENAPDAAAPRAGVEPEPQRALPHTRAASGQERDGDVPLLLAEPAAAEASATTEQPLGQYREGVSLAGAETPPAPGKAATPVAFRILQLKDDSLLENADPELLRADPKKALGSTYLSADDYILAPGQFKFVDFNDIDKKTRYIAVVAAFHDPNAARWHDVFRLEPRGRTYALLVTLQATRVAITDENYRPWPGGQGAPTNKNKP